MHRRRLLQAGLAAALASRFAWAGTDLPAAVVEKTGRPQRIAIIGAGLAGLSAGLELVRAGHEVTIFEASSRAGGRVRTWRSPFADGLYGEAGAARIPANHDLTLGYAKSFGLTTRPFYPAAGSVYDVYDGDKFAYPIHSTPELVHYPLPFSDEERTAGLDRLAERMLAPVMDRVGDLHADSWPPAELAAFDHHSISDWVRAQGMSDAVSRALALGFDDREGGGFGFLWVLREILMSPTSGAALVRIEGGNDLIAKGFADALAGRIAYGSELTAIGQDERGVELRLRGHSEPVRADRAIVTLPFSVLRTLSILSPISPGKRRAIEELGYCSLSRVALQVRGRHWLPEGMSGFAKTELPSEIWLFTHASKAPRDIVQVYIKGNVSEQLSTMSESNRIDFAREHVNQVFPGFADAVEGGVSVCWDAEPWARGAHAALRPGQSTTLMPHTMTAEGRLHFAGEHTSPFQGWMQGALYSGRRAAREVDHAGHI